jgi:hypothetical protein
VSSHLGRWCACINDLSNQPDVRCPKCGGSGERYDFQEFYEDSIRLGSRGDMVELPSEHIDCDILRVVDLRDVNMNTARWVNMLNYSMNKSISQPGKWLMLFSMNLL